MRARRHTVQFMVVHPKPLSTAEFSAVVIAAITLFLAPTHAETLTDRQLTWPKNSRFVCKGILVQEEGVYQLKPDKGMLAWCDASIGDAVGDIGNDFSASLLVNRVLNTCKPGDHCEIRGTIRGHGAFSWTAISSVTREPPR
jgi:hypothetical protein